MVVLTLSSWLNLVISRELGVELKDEWVVGRGDSVD